MYLVYKHTTPSGKVYIGITKQSADGRWKKGFGYQSSPHFWSAIKKYGWDNIKHEILHDGLTEEEACEYEKRYISEMQTTDRRYGYNQKTGGEVGVKFNDELRKKISEGRKKFYRLHPEKREEIAKRVTGFRHSDETKEKMRIIKTGTHIVLTDEWKKHIGDANRERIMSDERLYEDTVNRCRANGKKAARKVEQLDLDGNVVATFESAHDAQRVTGVRNGNINKCCRGDAKTSGGYRWRFAI